MSLDDRLVFVLGAPRSGTTLLARLLHATPGAFATPEPHLIPGLVHSGVLGRVDRAPYDPIRAQRAQRRFVAGLPGGEAAYLTALRGFCEELYAQALATGPAGSTHFVDKTPANLLAIESLARAFPRARYLSISRHPGAIFHSYAQSFFDGDFEAAWRFNPILARYLPRQAWLLRCQDLSLHALSFERLVRSPEESLSAVCRFLGLAYDPGALDYQRAPWPRGGEGDPVGAPRHERPEPSRAWAWTGRLARDEAARRVVERQLEGVSDADLALLGWPRDQLWAPLERAGSAPWGRDWSRHARRRRALLWARRALRNDALKPLRQGLRTAWEILDREGFGD
jgi:hypothetical protein